MTIEKASLAEGKARGPSESEARARLFLLPVSFPGQARREELQENDLLKGDIA